MRKLIIVSVLAALGAAATLGLQSCGSDRGFGVGGKVIIMGSGR